MKVDMDGKNCNLPSEHTPLGQTNTEKAANYKICEYLESIPGIHSETISFLSDSPKNTVELKNDDSAKSFWSALCNNAITMPHFKLFPGKASINPETVDIYLFKKLMGDPFRSAPEDSLLSYMFDGQNTIHALADYPTFITQLWCHKETRPLAPTLTLILTRDYTHKSPKCFRKQDHAFTDYCSLSALRDYLCALLPEKRWERFEKNHAYNSMLFSGSFLTREFFLLLGALKMLYEMAAENLSIRKRKSEEKAKENPEGKTEAKTGENTEEKTEKKPEEKAGENTENKTSDSSATLLWDVYEQAVLFSLFLTNPLNLLLDWQELARNFPELNCEVTTDSNVQASPSVDPEKPVDSQKQADPQEQANLQEQANPQEQANQQKQVNPQKQVDPHVQFELYVCAVLAPIFCASKDTRNTYQKAWNEFSHTLEKKVWEQEDEKSILRDLQNLQGSSDCTPFNMLDLYFAPKLVRSMNEDGFRYLFWLFYYESIFTGMMTVSSPFLYHLPNVCSLFLNYIPNTYKLVSGSDYQSCKATPLKTFNLNFELFMRTFFLEPDTYTEDSSDSLSDEEKEFYEFKSYLKYCLNKQTKEDQLYKEFDTLYEKATSTLSNICRTDIGCNIFLRYRQYLNAGWRPYPESLLVQDGVTHKVNP